MLIIQEIFGYFFIGLIGMLVLGILYLPVFLVLRKKVPVVRQAAYFLLAVCILVILMATVLESLLFKIMAGGEIIAEYRTVNLIPFHAFTEDWLMGTRKQITQNIANILMFIPLGFILPVALPKMRSIWKTAICAGLFSFLIEFIQYFIGRSADIDDWILNTLGGILGYAAFYLIRNCCNRSGSQQK